MGLAPTLIPEATVSKPQSGEYFKKCSTYNIMMKRAFLLERFQEVNAAANASLSYDPQLEVNMMYVNGKVTSACTVSTMITQSKTEAAPGDDDPDTDVEFMY